MKPNVKPPLPEEPKTNPNIETAEPVAAPQPPMDGKKPIPQGTDEVEKFLVATDSVGGD